MTTTMMTDLASVEMRRNPFPVYDHLRSGSPVLHEPSADAWMIFDYDGVKRALNDHESFSSSMLAAGRRHPEWLIFFDPPRHSQLRNLILKAFTPRVVANMESQIRALSAELLDQTASRDEIDLATDYAVPLPMKVIAGMIGIPLGDWPRFRHWSDVILRLSYTLADNEEAARASNEYAAVTAEMADYLPSLVAARRSAPGDDLLTRLIEAEVDGERLTPQEILGFFQILLVAGHETTTNLINNAILCLLDEPAQLARLRTTPGLIPNAIEEVLRYRSPVQWMFRATTRAVELNGHHIPAGKLVLPMIGSANRDPQQFSEPQRFDIGRDPNPHIAFGHGIHFCLGAALSRMEARIALTDLFQRTTAFELATSDPWEPRQALHVHGPSRLPLRIERAASQLPD